MFAGRAELTAEDAKLPFMDACQADAEITARQLSGEEDDAAGFSGDSSREQCREEDRRYDGRTALPFRGLENSGRRAWFSVRGVGIGVGELPPRAVDQRQAAAVAERDHPFLAGELARQVLDVAALHHLRGKKIRSHYSASKR